MQVRRRFKASSSRVGIRKLLHGYHPFLKNVRPKGEAILFISILVVIVVSSSIIWISWSAIDDMTKQVQETFKKRIEEIHKIFKQQSEVLREEKSVMFWPEHTTSWLYHKVRPEKPNRKITGPNVCSLHASISF